MKNTFIFLLSLMMTVSGISAGPITDLMRAANPHCPPQWFTAFETQDSPEQLSYAKGFVNNPPDPRVISFMGSKARHCYAEFACSVNQKLLYQQYGSGDASPHVKDAVYKALRALGVKNAESVHVKKLNQNKTLPMIDGQYYCDRLIKIIWIREESPDWYFTCFHEAAHCYRVSNNLHEGSDTSFEEYCADHLAATVLCRWGEHLVVKNSINNLKCLSLATLETAIRATEPKKETQDFLITLLNKNFEQVIKNYAIEHNGCRLAELLKYDQNGYPYPVTRLNTMQRVYDYCAPSNIPGNSTPH